jgi:hypothetical protein
MLAVLCHKFHHIFGNFAWTFVVLTSDSTPISDGIRNCLIHMHVIGHKTHCPRFESPLYSQKMLDHLMLIGAVLLSE